MCSDLIILLYNHYTLHRHAKAIDGLLLVLLTWVKNHGGEVRTVRTVGEVLTFEANG